MKKTIKTAILTLLLLTLTVSTAFLAYLHFFASDVNDLSGEWTAEIDLTKQAAVSAYSWLQDIEGVSLSLEETEAYIPELTVRVDLSFAQTVDAAGTFYCSVSPESYEACLQTAYGALRTAFHDLLAERLHMAGYTGSTEEEALEALVVETFGMSTEEYLAASVPGLLPLFDTLQARFDGGGTYEITEGVLTRRFEEEGTVVTRMETCIRQDGQLILLEETGADSSVVSSDEYPVVYTLRQSAK